MDSGKPDGQDSIPRGKKLISVHLLGQEIQLKSSRSEGEIAKIVNYLEERYRSLPPLSYIKKILLLLLEVTDELFQERKNKEVREKEWEKRLEHLLSLLTS